MNDINTNNPTYSQGELCFCRRVSFGGELNTKDGRPFIIISDDLYNQQSDKVTGVFLTHGERQQPSPCVVRMDESCGYKYNNSYISIGEVVTVDKARLCDRVGMTSQRVLDSILSATGEYFGIKLPNLSEVNSLSELCKSQQDEINDLKSLIIKLTNKLVDKGE